MQPAVKRNESNDGIVLTDLQKQLNEAAKKMEGFFHLVKKVTAPVAFVGSLLAAVSLYCREKINRDHPLHKLFWRALLINGAVYLSTSLISYKVKKVNGSS